MNNSGDQYGGLDIWNIEYEECRGRERKREYDVERVKLRLEVEREEGSQGSR